MDKAHTVLSTFIVRINAEPQIDAGGIQWTWRCTVEQAQTGVIQKLNAIRDLPGIIEEALQNELRLISLIYGKPREEDQP